MSEKPMNRDIHEELEYFRRSFKILSDENKRLRELMLEAGIKDENARVMPSGDPYDCPTVAKVVTPLNPTQTDEVSNDAMVFLAKEINNPESPLFDWVRKRNNKHIGNQ